MGAIFTSEMKKTFDKEKFLIIRDAMDEKSCRELTNAFNTFKKHKLFTLSSNPNNHSIKNSHRQQSVLFSNEFYAKNEKDFHTIREWFNHTSSLLFPILDPVFDNLFKNLQTNWTVMRITTMHIFPGCPEQQIHHDNDAGDNILFISIPLHNTTKNMGPTIFYCDEYVKHLRKPAFGKGADEEAMKKGIFYNNLGYFHEFNETNQQLLKKARRQYNLKLGDYTVHRDITIHHGGANLSKKERKMLFIMVAIGDISICDYFEVDKGLHLVDSKRHD